MSVYVERVREYDRLNQSILDHELQLAETRARLVRFLESLAGVEPGDVILDFKGEMLVTRVNASYMKPFPRESRFTNPGIYGVRRLAGGREWGKREVSMWGGSWQVVSTAGVKVDA